MAAKPRSGNGFVAEGLNCAPSRLPPEQCSEPLVDRDRVGSKTADSNRVDAKEVDSQDRRFETCPEREWQVL